MRAAVRAAKVAHAYIRGVLRVRCRTEEVLETGEAVSLFINISKYTVMHSKNSQNLEVSETFNGYLYSLIKVLPS